MDRFIAVSGLVLGVILLGFVGAIIFSPSPALGGDGIYSADGAITAATNFVKTDSTFKFDGMADTLKVSLNHTIANDKYEIMAEFTSAHGGYGNRFDQMVIQALTPHKAILTVEKGQIVAAIMDNQWDMIAGKSIDAGKPATMPARDPSTVTNTTAPVDGLQK